MKEIEGQAVAQQNVMYPGQEEDEDQLMDNPDENNKKP